MLESALGGWFFASSPGAWLSAKRHPLGVFNARKPDISSVNMVILVATYTFIGSGNKEF